jgi:hypothetical protein
VKFLLVVILLAVVVYLLVRAIQRRGIAPTPRRDLPDPRPSSPDDDPDFLRDLDRRRKHPEDPDA